MTSCVVCAHPVSPYPVKVTARSMCWDEVACRARVREMKGAALMSIAGRKTLIQIEHSTEIASADMTDCVRDGLRAYAGIRAVRLVAPDTVETEFRVRVEHDVEFTPGDMAHQIKRALKAAEITCLVCERQGGACCEYGPDAA